MTPTDATGPAVGVQAVGGYFGDAFVDTGDLFDARGLDRSRLANLRMVRRAAPLPGEDVVTLAATAARPVVDAMSASERAGLRAVVAATESSFDMSKAIGTYLHRLLDLPRNCRVFEVKQACYGGVAALQIAVALVRADPTSRVLVVASDLSLPERGTLMEPSQGLGAVAVLVGAQPAILEIDHVTAGTYSYEIADFARPRHDVDVVDTDLSLMSYLDCLLGSFTDHAARRPGADFAASYDLLAMHTPFPGMVRGAHRTALRKLGPRTKPAVQEDFERRVAPSLRLPEQVGNIYSATTLLAMLSAVAHAPHDEGAELGVFSYGSGCSSEFFACRMPAGARQRIAAAGLPEHLAERHRLTVPEYDALTAEAAATMFAVPDAVVGPGRRFVHGPPGRPRAVLARVEGYRREYAWFPQ
ncbi:hydroxymethylglutaryl-CoA synthase family protein [Streptomyces sp. NPDC057798]|uniref:hydroxymethylglutaryl-CoA synthase family protein n=1 Tax=Streptomyces sp. NPDC057798 TaxID=3346252 RepID=UPI0036793698